MKRRNCYLDFAKKEKHVIFATNYCVYEMEAFFKTHKYLVEHVSSPVKRGLMQEIDWSRRLIGIKGSRGVGKTTFLLQYAKENFGPDDRTCLYINLNNLYFADKKLSDFVDEFYRLGGRCLLIDQVFKYPTWAEELAYCYRTYSDLYVIFSGSSVMRLKEEESPIQDIVDSYNLRGYSFREFLNLMAGTDFPSVKLDDILRDHTAFAREVISHVHPLSYFKEYLHHGFYPFFLEQHNFTEALVKTMNMMMEVDILFIKQIELTYLPKIRRLLYLLATSSPCSPNVSQLSKEIQTSRATVVNYIKYLKDARLINMLYPVDEEFPRKPARVYLHNTNLMYPIGPEHIDPKAVRETFFYNILHKDNRLNEGIRNTHFLVNRRYNFKIEGETLRGRNNPDYYYAMDNNEVGKENKIPLWLFGFLY